MNNKSKKVMQVQKAYKKIVRPEDVLFKIIKLALEAENKTRRDSNE